jgi:hypothetical protein
LFIGGYDSAAYDQKVFHSHSKALRYYNKDGVKDNEYYNGIVDINTNKIIN